MLTIGIPTYNRVTAISEHIEELIASSVYDVAQVLIIDNASPDGTFERLKEICNGTSIRVLRNPKNIGIQGNFVRLFEDCTTEYLIVTSDEDPVIPAHLGALVDCLETHKSLLVSPQVYLNEGGGMKLYRGRHKTRRMVPKEFWDSSFYMSGLVYRVEESRQALVDIKYHIEQPGQIYPLVLLAAELMLRGPCFWWNKPLTEKRHQLPTHIEDPLHGKYYFLPARWHQHKLFVDFLKDRIEKASTPESRRMAEKMLEGQHERLIYSLRNAVSLERPDLISYFDRGTRGFYLKHSIAAKYFRLLRSLLRKLRRCCRGS